VPQALRRAAGRPRRAAGNAVVAAGALRHLNGAGVFFALWLEAVMRKSEGALEIQKIVPTALTIKLQSRKYLFCQSRQYFF
jgi:hypothetical protein